ncbi:shikimate kinase [Vigna unguiculata]|uniref:Shikimate kinase n=1 Tax=Vigna unguiculata TaxID=3917 RepID=A0A4D6LZN1_VIGUN|nr:shikimate kinase [Vigna unguiculata]
MEKLSVSHMNARFAFPNRSFDFLQFKHSIFFLKFPNTNQNPNPNPNLLRLRRLNCSVSDGTVPSSVGATDSTLVVKKIVLTVSLVLVQKKAAEVSSDLKGTSIFLVGMKSSLKTSLGKLLADALRYYYFDSDSLVEEAVGGALAAKSFRESDTKGFYESETEVLKQLSSMGRLVVSAGNGAVISPTNLALVRHGISLWIDVPLDLVARDVTEDQSQFTPSEISISGSYPEVKDELGALYDKYRAGYATADAIISVQKVASRLGCDNLDEVTTEDLTLEALKEIEKLTRVKKMIEEAARPF